VLTAPLAGGPSTPVTLDAALDWAPTFTPDGTHLVFASDRSGARNLWQVPIDESTGRTLGPPEPLTVAPGAWLHGASFARDGRSFAFVAGTQQYVIDRLPFDAERAQVTGPPVRLVDGDSGVLRGDLLAFHTGGTNEQVLLQDLRSGTRSVISGDGARNRAPAFSPDGQWILFSSTRSGKFDAYRVHPDGSGLEKLFEEATGPNPASDGRRLTVSDYAHHAIYLIDLEDRAHKEKLPALPDGSTYLVSGWSPDGTRLIGCQNYDWQQPAWLYTLATGSYQRLADHCTSPQFLPDGKRWIDTDPHNIWVHDLAGGAPRVVYSVAPEKADRVTLSADHASLVLTRNLAASDVWLATLGEAP
jgi:Tol biopolymer transport system component